MDVMTRGGSGPFSRMVRAFTLILLMLACPAAAQVDMGLDLDLDPDIFEFDPVSVSHVWSATGVEPGGQITLAVVLGIEEPYHVQAHRLEDQNLIATTVELIGQPDVVQASTPLYPEAIRVPFQTPRGTKLIPAYGDGTAIYIPLSVTGAAAPGELNLAIQVTTQACDDRNCFKATVEQIGVALTVVEPGTPITPTHVELFARMPDPTSGLRVPFFGWDFEINPDVTWMLLVVAAVGGFLLNLTPCVLPVIPIKIMGLSQAAGSRRRTLVLGLSMSLGIVVFWLGLAEAIWRIRDFETTNALMQKPEFTVTVGAIITMMAVGMMGLFSVRLPKVVYAINPSQDTLAGSFGFGVMTAILSTPCTAPFMGAASAWAATQPDPAITRATFAAIGIGMALPYLVLSAWPALVHRVPRTGPASAVIKQVMGLLMLAAGTYFVGTGVAGWTVEAPDPPSRLYWWVVGVFIALAGGWLAVQTLRHAKACVWPRVVFTGLGVLLIAGGTAMGIRLTDRGPIDWIYFTPERLEAAEMSNKVVVLEFTAAWCLNCHALEQAVLHRSEVTTLLNRDDVAAIKVDITGNNEAGSRKLVEVGRRAIPYLVIYGRDGRVVFSSDAYTVEQVTSALGTAIGTGDEL